MFEALHQQKNFFVLDRGIKVRAAQPYALSLELSMMVRLASAVQTRFFVSERLTYG